MDSIRSYIYLTTQAYKQLQWQSHNNHKNGFRSKSTLRPKGARVFKLKIQAASVIQSSYILLVINKYTWQLYVPALSQRVQTQTDVSNI